MEMFFVNTLILSTVTYFICLLMTKKRGAALIINLAIMIIAGFFIQDYHGPVLTIGDMAQNLASNAYTIGYYFTWLITLIISDKIIAKRIPSNRL